MSGRLRKTLLYLAMVNKAKGGKSPNVDGTEGFVFLTKNGSVFKPSAINKFFKQATKAYNRALKDCPRGTDEKEIDVTPHILRHTFCTRLCEVESNLKVIQELMGHSDIRITMEVYSEAQKDGKNESLKKYDTLIEKSII